MRVSIVVQLAKRSGRETAQASNACRRVGRFMVEATDCASERQLTPPCFTSAASITSALVEDRFGHRISYLRVSITDRCNERCTYCMPRELQEWLPREDILTYEETLRLIRIAARLGVRKVRVTGGEPLTRRDVISFCTELTRITGIDDVGLSTNGTLLARE